MVPIEIATREAPDAIGGDRDYAAASKRLSMPRPRLPTAPPRKHTDTSTTLPGFGHFHQQRVHGTVRRL